jgi:hypothetical protein
MTNSGPIPSSLVRVLYTMYPMEGPGRFPIVMKDEPWVAGPAVAKWTPARQTAQRMVHPNQTEPGR